jgi:hypothetical protein
MTQDTGWEATDEIRGIRGWLLLPLIYLAINLVYIAWRVFDQLPVVAMRVPQHPRAAQIAFVLVLVPYFAFLVLCLVRFLQERRVTRWLMTAYCGSNILFAAILLVQGATALMLAHLIFNIGALAYFHASVRVQNTFAR